MNCKFAFTFGALVLSIGAIILGVYIYPRIVSCDFSDMSQFNTTCSYSEELTTDKSPTIDYCWKDQCENGYSVITQSCIEYIYTVKWGNCTKSFKQYYLDDSLPPYEINSTCYENLNCDDPFQPNDLITFILFIVFGTLSFITYILLAVDLERCVDNYHRNKGYINSDFEF